VGEVSWGLTSQLCWGIRPSNQWSEENYKWCGPWQSTHRMQEWSTRVIFCFNYIVVKRGELQAMFSGNWGNGYDHLNFHRRSWIKLRIISQAVVVDLDVILLCLLAELRFQVWEVSDWILLCLNYRSLLSILVTLRKEWQLIFFNLRFEKNKKNWMKILANRMIQKVEGLFRM